MVETEKCKIIVVHSYKGGTGKTSIAVNLARYLTQEKEKEVLLIEQDTGGPSFRNIFRVDTTKDWNDFYTPGADLRDAIVKHRKLDIICARAEQIAIPTDQTAKQFYTRHLERLSMQKKWMCRKYDYILIDTHPGYNYGLLNSLFIADIAILLTRLDVDTIEQTITMYDQIYSNFTEKKIVIVQNQVPLVEKEDKPIIELDADIERALNKWEEFAKDKRMVTIPLDTTIAYRLSKSKLIALNSTFMEYIADIYNKL